MTVHKSAEVQTIHIGKGTTVWQNCVILKGAVIGDNCNINFNVFIENEVVVGNNVTIKSGVQLWDGVTVEDNVFIGPNATFTNDLVPRIKFNSDNSKSTFVKHYTLLKKGASIGANATIVAGVTIGQYSLIGAGSVVTKTTPPYTVWYGNPAKHHGYITEDGVLLNKELKSKDGQEYTFKNDLLVSK